MAASLPFLSGLWLTCAALSIAYACACAYIVLYCIMLCFLLGNVEPPPAWKLWAPAFLPVWFYISLLPRFMTAEWYWCDCCSCCCCWKMWVLINSSMLMGRALIWPFLNLFCKWFMLGVLTVSCIAVIPFWGLKISCWLNPPARTELCG